MRPKTSLPVTANLARGIFFGPNLGGDLRVRTREAVGGHILEAPTSDSGRRWGALFSAETVSWTEGQPADLEGVSDVSRGRALSVKRDKMKAPALSCRSRR